MITYIRMMPWLPNMQDPKLLTVQWRLFCQCGTVYVMHCVGWKGRHYFIYDLLPQSDSGISQDAIAKIYDAAMTLIFRMGLGAHCYCFCPYGQPTSDLWRFATNHELGYPRNKTNNRYCSIDAHFQDGAGSMSRMCLPFNVASTSFMDVLNQSPVRLPKIQDRNILSLHLTLILMMGQRAFR